MSNLIMWSTVIGFLLPNLVSIVQQPRFTPPIRASITAVACILGGFGTAYFNNQFNFQDIVGSVLLTGVSAITFYKGFWKPTGVAPAIENATSKTPPTVQDLHPSDGPDMRGDANVRRTLREDGAIDVLQAALLVFVIVCVLYVLVRII